MQPDITIEEVTAKIRDVGERIVASGTEGPAKAALIARFHELREDQKRARRAQSQQVVYFIHAPLAGLIKIGRTTNIGSRLSSLRMSSPVHLFLLRTIEGGVEKEAELHRRWQAIRQHGEWFSATPELIAEIDGPVFDSTRPGQ